MMWFQRVLNEKCVEPEQRNKDGMRWISHRFPIKGGISLREVMIKNFSANNNFLREFSRGDYRVGETLKIRLPGGS